MVNIGAPIGKLYPQWFKFKIGSIIMYLIFYVKANSLKIIALEWVFVVKCEMVLAA